MSLIPKVFSSSDHLGFDRMLHRKTSKSISFMLFLADIGKKLYICS